MPTPLEHAQAALHEGIDQTGGADDPDMLARAAAAAAVAQAEALERIATALAGYVGQPAQGGAVWGAH